LLTVDPDRRITIAEVAEHPWMTAEPKPRHRLGEDATPYVGVKRADKMFEDDDDPILPPLAHSPSFGPGDVDTVLRSISSPTHGKRVVMKPRKSSWSEREAVQKFVMRPPATPMRRRGTVQPRVPEIQKL
jgi:hypothetical protein